MEPTEEHVERILGAGLDDLVRTAGDAVRPLPGPGDWRLPDRDRDALWRHGLPAERDDGLIAVVAGFQPGAEPALTHDGTALYRLGTFGAATLAATRDAGAVLGIPASTQVPPDLRHLYPDGIRPAPVNSTVADLVDCAWRWSLLLPLLAGQEERAGAAEVTAWRAASAAEQQHPPDFYDAYRALCRRVAAAFARRDPIVAQPGSFWHDAVLGHVAADDDVGTPPP